MEAVLHRKVVTKTAAPVSSSAKCSSRALTLASVQQILVIFFKCKMSCSFILVPLGCSEHSAGKTLYLLRYAIMLVTLGEGHYLTFEGINLWAFHASVCRGLNDCPWTCVITALSIEQCLGQTPWLLFTPHPGSQHVILLCTSTPSQKAPGREALDIKLWNGWHTA